MASFRTVLSSFLLLSLPLAAFACSCIEDITIANSLEVAEAAFRGFVVRKLRDVDYQVVYVVEVKKMYKGCNFKASEQILVTTGSNSALCGIDIKVNGTYALFGYGTPIVPRMKRQIQNTTIKRAVNVGLCDFNTQWSKLRRADLQKLRSYDNSDCVVTCTTGADCKSTEYCDAGTCYPYKETCANPVNCVAAPCDVTDPCVDDVQCIDHYCGGCFAIFVDDTGTRVCNTPL